MALMRVLYNERIGGAYYKLGLEPADPAVAKGSGAPVVPGQFVMVKVSEGCDPLLRRPFSVYNLPHAGGGMEFGLEILYRAAGRGTAIMSAWEAGRTTDVLGPLGSGFPVLAGKTVMVAGGIGAASLYLYAKAHPDSPLFFGGRSEADAALAADFRALGTRVAVATEDGSVGVKGFVTELIDEELTPGAVIVACGPSGMLKAVALIARQKGLKCYVSMESSMGCGMGACLGCAVKTKTDGYKMVCTDGPVFDSDEIDFDEA